MKEEQDIGARRSIGAQRNPESAAAILNAAEELLAERGYSGFSIEGVARLARAGKPTIYRWWPSKAALLLDVYKRQKRDVVYADTGDIEEDLFLLLSSIIRQWANAPTGGVFRSIVAEAQGDESAAKALADYARERRQNTGAMISRAVERGQVRADIEPEVIGDMVAAFAWIHLLTNRLDVSDAEIRQAVSVMVRGIK
ncbi:MAG: TetR/AcrR family transcriptional regulator [Mesorhizobium sp.]